MGGYSVLKLGEPDWHRTLTSTSPSWSFPPGGANFTSIRPASSVAISKRQPSVATTLRICGVDPMQ